MISPASVSGNGRRHRRGASAFRARNPRGPCVGCSGSARRGIPVSRFPHNRGSGGGPCIRAYGARDGWFTFGQRRQRGGRSMSAALADVAVVTGASGGIGRATACVLAGQGMGLCLSGRDAGRLADVATEVRARAGQVLVYAADLWTDEGIRGLAARVAADVGQVDVLVHAAGTIRLGNVESAAWNDLDEQYQVNLRAPFSPDQGLPAHPQGDARPDRIRQFDRGTRRGRGEWPLCGGQARAALDHR